MSSSLEKPEFSVGTSTEGQSADNDPRWLRFIFVVLEALSHLPGFHVASQLPWIMSYGGARQIDALQELTKRFSGRAGDLEADAGPESQL